MPQDPLQFSNPYNNQWKNQNYQNPFSTPNLPGKTNKITSGLIKKIIDGKTRKIINGKTNKITSGKISKINGNHCKEIGS